jgi:tetratricopeptide (TPR) repeat protein
MIAPGISCKKYLDEKPLQSKVIPEKLSELQALLDNTEINQSGPRILELVSDNYYLTSSDWQNRPLDERLNYIWDNNANFNIAWTQPYQKTVYTANIVLDQLPLLPKGEREKPGFGSIKGSALFYRAFEFLELAQLYCKPYATENLGELGIVLRQTAAVEEKSTRSTVKQTYDQVISDLLTASDLLPSQTAFPTRPNKAAAYGTLARAYLIIGNYAEAKRFSNLCLQEYNQLLDYNTLLPLSSPPFKLFNKEVIYHNILSNVATLAKNRAKIDSTLYRSYDKDDLRKTLYFSANTGVNAGTYGFRGSYEGITDFSCFDGIASDEIYLIRAECFARLNNKDSALIDINTLMKNRWKNSVIYPPITAIDANDALSKILIERRKELVYRGLRWSDIRRLNTQGANLTLKRVVNNITYTLPPNDLRSVMLIPKEVISLSGIAQNPR